MEMHAYKVQAHEKHTRKILTPMRHVSNTPTRCTPVVARSKQVYIEWVEAIVLSIYLPEKRTFICTLDPTLLPEAALAA